MNLKVLGAVLGTVVSVISLGSFAAGAFAAAEAVTPAASPARQSGTAAKTPRFVFSLQPTPGSKPDSKLGKRFNDAMDKYWHKTVYLSVTLDEEMSQSVGKRMDNGNLSFTVMGDPNERETKAKPFVEKGVEYVIHLSEKDADPVQFKGKVAVLSGYFNVYEGSGPLQGYMSLHLRPVKVD
jgi:hypothetical protein